MACGALGLGYYAADLGLYGGWAGYDLAGWGYAGLAHAGWGYGLGLGLGYAGCKNVFSNIHDSPVIF